MGFGHSRRDVCAFYVSSSVYDLFLKKNFKNTVHVCVKDFPNIVYKPDRKTLFN